jgi:hypothetical protein
MLYTFPPSTVQALDRLLCCLSSEGETFKSGVEEGRPRRLAPEFWSRAQSRGLWPAERRTFFRGLDGILLAVGGRAKEEVGGLRFSRGRGGGGIEDCERGASCGGREEETRWAELRAGNVGFVESSDRENEGIEEVDAVSVG